MSNSTTDKQNTLPNGPRINEQNRDRIQDLLSVLRGKGARIWIDQGQLRCEIPDGALTPEDHRRLDESREALSAFVQKQSVPFFEIKPLLIRPPAIPLSFQQHQLWLADLISSFSAVYLVPSGWRLRGSLDVKALESSFQALIARHEILRTRFMMKQGEPVQVIEPLQSFCVEILDFSHLASLDAEASLLDQMHAQSTLTFDLAAGPLLRVLLIKLEAESYALLMTMHHIVSDGWSANLMSDEICALYKAFVEGDSLVLPKLAIQYADYALWQRNWFQGPILEGLLSYWRQQLVDMPQIMELPADRPRPASASLRGDRFTVTLQPRLAARLKDLGREQGVTLFMVMLATFQLLLSRLSGQNDVIIGSPIAGRTRAETHHSIGFFLNTLVLRTRIDYGQTFFDLLRQVRETTLGAYAHQELPFEKLVEELQPQRDVLNQPLFQVFFSLEKSQDNDLRLVGLESTPLQMMAPVAKFDLSLYVQEKETLTCTFEYSTDLFDLQTIERFSAYFLQLLNAASTGADCRLDAMPLLSETEELSILSNWNETYCPYPKHLCVHQMFSEQVRQSPLAPAVIFGAERLSYVELDRRANQLAHYLHASGAKCDAIIGLCMPFSADRIVAWLGILKAGAAYLPLDDIYPDERLLYMINDARASLVITSQGNKARFSQAGIVTICLDEEECIKNVNALPSHEPMNNVSPSNLAYVVYTSGSTGAPKAVAAPHVGIVNRIFAQQQFDPIRVTDICCQKTAVSFVDSIFETLAPLALGRPLVVLGQAAQHPDELASSIQHHKVTRLITVPSLAEALTVLDRPERLASLRSWTLSGSVLTEVLCQSLQRTVPHCRIFNLYGCSEVAADATFCAVGGGGDKPVLIGRPMSNTKIYVLDPQLQLAPVGVTGELYVAGDGLARGYLGFPGLTAQRFIADPYAANGSRMYQTGDLVRYLADGNLQFIGRRDHQVKVRGHRIELSEIEAALSKHPLIRKAVVLDHQENGEDSRLVAYIVNDNDARSSGNKVRQYLQGILPEYMIPSFFVFLDALPLTPSGKLDRIALIAMPTRPAVVHSPGILSPMEEVVANIWQEVLQTRRVGPDDNFFQLGGHSLLATQVVARIREHLGVEISMRVLFRPSLTLKTLAGLVEDARRSVPELSIPPLIPQQRGGALPLSFGQERLWFLDQLQLLGAAYHEGTAFRLEGKLNVLALERSFGELIRRHELLRTSFESMDGTPTQVVGNPGVFVLPVIDLQVLSPDAAIAEVDRWSTEEVIQPFDLSCGPMLRVSLLRLAPELHFVLITMHHISSDGWSLMGVMPHELGILYKAFLSNLPSPLAELSIQYADYAIWQRGWLQGEVLEHQLAYWKEQLGGAPAALELPTDRPRLTVPSFRGGRVPIQLTEELTVGLRALAYQEGVTMYMVLLAGLQVLLSRWSGQQDIVVGSPIAGRIHQELEGLIGYFANTLALRTDLTGEPSFREVLRRVRETALGAYAHQDLPFEKLVAELQTRRDLSRHPIFQVVFAFHTVPRKPLELSGLTLTQSYRKRSTSKFDLFFELYEDGLLVQGNLEYASDLFDKETVERLVLYLERVLLSVVREPGLAITALSLLREEEVEEQVHEWNLTECSYAWDRGVHELIGKQAARTPLAVAVRDAAGELRYGELDEQANQLGHYLRSVGVGPEVVVGLCVRRSRALVVGILGILRAGGAYLPLDEHQPVERLGYLLEDAGVTVVVTESSLEAMLPSVWGQVVVLDEESQREVIASQPREAPEVAVHADNVAYVIYTSGSTGSPKGVMVRHGGLSNYVQYAAERFSTDEGTGSPINSSASFDLVVTSLYPTLIGGKTLHLLSGKDDVQELAELLRNGHDLTLMKLTPSHLEALTKLLAWEDLKGRVRSIVLGGEKLALSVVSGWHQASPETRFYNHYGPTETTVGCIVQAIDWESESGGIVPIGRPISNMRVYVLDGHVRPVPQGTIGELYIAGAGLARGYLGRAGLTAERFLADPYGPPGSRMYQTGDRVRYRPDRTLEFIGRTDYQVKIRGYRVELGEVEARMRACPGVAQAVVVAREEPGEVTRLVAYVVAGQQRIEGQELRSQLQRSLPEYMVPASYVFLDALPLTTNGKIDRGRLPAPDTGISTSRYVAAQTPVEQTLATIWCEVLKLERVGVEEDFFELGGHSLLATRVVAQVREVLTVEVPLRELFEQPRIRELAERIEWLRRQQLGTMLPPLEHQARPSGGVVLSFAQERLWFLEQMGLVGAAYTIPLGLRLRGVLDARALEASFAELVRRHESLRTRFEMQEGEAVQVIDAPAVFGLEQHDLRALTPELQEQEIQLQMKRRSQQSLDLMNGPLFNVALFLLQEREHVVLLTMHHIISDGWSGGILVRELSTLYAVYSQGLPSPLPELPIQYADYARWQRSWLCGDVLNRQLAYWREQLSGAPAALELPTDHPRPAVASYQGLKLPFTLDKALTEKLLALARREHTTLFMVLLAAYQLLLARLSGQNDVVVGSPIAGRTHRQTEDLIGFFVNTLVMRTHLQPQFSFRQLLQHVKNVTLAAYDHQDLPFEKLVAELQPQRSLSRQPIFQVAFALQNLEEEEIRLGALELAPLSTLHFTAKSDLYLSVFQKRAGIECELEYATDLFEPSTIERWSAHFQMLLQAIVADPLQPLTQLPLLGENDRRTLLIEWNANRRDYPTELCVHDLLSQQARYTPDAPALALNKEQLTYAELNRSSNQLASYLQALGAGPEKIVGLCVERSFDMVIGIFGILKSGAAYLPLDESYPPDRLAFMLDDAGADLVVTQERYLHLLGNTGRRVVCLDADRSQINARSAAQPTSAVRPDNLAYLLYTSGSTGKPKGVIVQHSSVCNFIVAQRRFFDLHAEDRVLQFARLGFDISLFEIAMAFHAGATLCLVSPSLARGASLPQVLTEQRITVAVFVSSALQSLQGHEFPNLRTMFIGGEVCPLELADHWSKRCRFISGYGPTEATIAATFTDYTSGSGALSIGRPCPNVSAYVLDAEMEPVPIGVTGELYLGGVGVARGYLGRSGLTAQIFVANPFEYGSRLYKTGDLVQYQPNRNLKFVGRVDNQVKIRGFRIELGEIESVLLTHPRVSQVAVEVREDVIGVRKLVAYVVSRESGLPEASELVHYLKRALPDHMVPSVFVEMPAMPISSGKLDRSLLPVPADRQATANFAAPRTRIENILSAAWKEVLRADAIGIYDNFFELGGDSIQLIKVASRANRQGVKVTARQMFQHQTIAELALVADVEESPLTEQIAIEGDIPLSPIQHWFLEAEQSSLNHLNFPALLEFHAGVSSDVLENAINRLAEHHDALRLKFVREGDDWRQWNQLAIARIPVDYVDLSGLDFLERSATFTRIATELQTSLDISVGLLVRAALFNFGPDRPPYFLWIIHHLAVDGVSWRILLEDLRTIYPRLERNEEAQLPPKTTSYKRWSETIQEYATSESGSMELKYWASLPWYKSHPLPRDKNRGLNTVASVRSVLRTMENVETDALLHEVSATLHVQVNEVLLAALAQAVARWSGHSEVLVDIEGHGRSELLGPLDVSRTVGCFTSIHPAIFILDGASGYGELLTVIKDQFRAIPHRGAGYSALKQFGSHAELLSIPRPEISFNYLGRLDHDLSDGALFRLGTGDIGPLQDPAGMRRHLIAISSSIQDGSLSLRIAYSANIHLTANMERLADDMIAHLRSGIQHATESTGTFRSAKFALIDIAPELPLVDMQRKVPRE